MRGYYHVMRGCSEHTVAANEGYYHVNERGAIVLCKQQNAALRRGLHAYTVGSSVQHLRQREIPLLPHLPSALRTAMEGGREKPG